MKKTYIQPMMEVVEVHPNAIMLAGSLGWPTEDTATILEEESNQDDFY